MVVLGWVVVLLLELVVSSVGAGGAVVEAVTRLVLGPAEVEVVGGAVAPVHAPKARQARTNRRRTRERIGGVHLENRGPIRLRTALVRPRENQCESEPPW